MVLIVLPQMLMLFFQNKEMFVDLKNMYKVDDSGRPFRHFMVLYDPFSMWSKV